MFMLSFIFVIVSGLFEWKRICVGFYTPAPQRGRGVYCFTSVRPSIQDIFRRIFLSNCWLQKSDIWSQASYRYTILWVAFLDPSDSYFLFTKLVGFYTHWTYMHNTFFVTFFSVTIDGRNLIFGPIRFLLPVCRLCWFLYTLNSDRESHAPCAICAFAIEMAH